MLPEARLLRVALEELVTIAAIAARAGRTPESVRLLALERRGPGGFPAPAGRIDARTQVWRWHEVAEWFERAMGLELPEGEQAAFLATVNGILEFRRVAPRAIGRPQEARALARLLPGELVAQA